MSSLPTSNATITYEYVCCWKCSLHFGVPAMLVSRRREDGRKFWCPNGHGMVFRKGPTEAEIDARRRKVRELHDAEQAEARAAEAKTPAPTETTDRPAGRQRLKCPQCDTTYLQTPRMRRHLMIAHGRSGDQAGDILASLLAKNGGTNAA